MSSGLQSLACIEMEGKGPESIPSPSSCRTEQIVYIEVEAVGLGDRIKVYLHACVHVCEWMCECICVSMCENVFV